MGLSCLGLGFDRIGVSSARTYIYIYIHGSYRVFHGGIEVLYEILRKYEFET